MKKLYLIGGTMGVGKTAIGHRLSKALPNSVFLDGDWCWLSHPFQVTEETKAMVMDNITHLLNNFIHCSVYENIIFVWVMHEQPIIDSILEKLDVSDCDVRCISLIADEKSLRERLQKDIRSGIRSEEILERSLKRLPLYAHLNTIKIDTSNQTPEAIVSQIKEL